MGKSENCFAPLKGEYAGRSRLLGLFFGSFLFCKSWNETRQYHPPFKIFYQAFWHSCECKALNLLFLF